VMFPKKWRECKRFANEKHVCKDVLLTAWTSCGGYHVNTHGGGRGRGRGSGGITSRPVNHGIR